MANESLKTELDEVKTQSQNRVSDSLSLFERILRHNRRSLSTDVKNFGTKDDKRRNEGKETLIQEVFAKSASEIVVYIMDKEISISQRLNVLNYLIEKRSDDRTLVADKLIRFSEELCRLYCSPKSSMDQELEMLLPVLKALRKLDEREQVFPRNVNFVYDLMRACSTCVTTYLYASKELRKITLRKTLAGRIKILEGRNFFQEISRTLGVPDIMEDSEFQCSKGIFSTESMLLHLYDTTKSDFERDINKHIEEMNLPKLPALNNKVKSSDDTSGEVFPESVKKEEWTDVEITRVLPFGEILAATDKDWRAWVNHIDGELMQFLKYCSQEIKEEEHSRLKIGTPVGFWTSDASIPGCRLPVNTRCMRGIAIGKAPVDFCEGANVSWAIWAVDIGVLAFCSKIWPLNKNLKDYKPLMSLCSLDLQIRDSGKKEREFLLAALPILTEVLANKPNAARHIITHDAGNFYTEEDKITSMDLLCTGGAFLMLIEYPDGPVRLEFLKLILSLTRNSVEVLNCLMEFKFYLAVCTRLEILVHFCGVASEDSTFWPELHLLLKVLTAILYESEKYTNEIPGIPYVQKVLIMLTNIDHQILKFMAAKCNAILVDLKSKLRATEDFGTRKLARRKVNENKHGATGLLAIKKHTHTLQTRTMPIIDSSGTSSILSETKDVDPEPVLSVMDLEDDEDDNDYDTSLPAVNAVLYPKVKRDFYAKGWQLDMRSSDTIELCPEKSPNQISEKDLATIVCSFLNNGTGGSVFYGINSEGIVEGINIDRLKRDTFRKGIDRMMIRGIHPEVRPNCYQINYIPVTRGGAKIPLLSAHKTWVIEIQVKALPHLIYTVASNHKCYIRRGTKCVEGIALCMRQDAAEQAKQEIEKAIQEFKAKIPKTKEKLVKFVRDYLSETSPNLKLQN